MLLDKSFDSNSRLGKISKLGLAPVLWCIIFVLLVTYIHSVILGIYLSFHIWNQLCVSVSTVMHIYAFFMAVWLLLPSCLLILSSATNMPKLTASTGLFAWFGVLLATVGLVMFYRCSRWVLWTSKLYIISWKFSRPL